MKQIIFADQLIDFSEFLQLCIIKIYQMDNSPKSVTTHRHYHYHYHYEVSDKHQVEESERYSSPSMMNSKKSPMTPYKGSWKNHINPEVTKMYEEISVHESFDDNFTPKASRQSQGRMREFSSTANPVISRRSPRSRAQILQEISTYKQFLKEHSQPNLYVPSTPTLKRMQSSESQQSLARGFVSLNELVNQRENRRTTLQEMVKARTDSKMVSTKQDLSTMYETQNPNQSELYFSKSKMLESQKYVRQSEIKSPRSSSNIFEKAKIRMSYIEDPSHRQKAEELENSNFSLFQREGKKESSGKNSQVFEGPVKNDSQKGRFELQQGDKQKNADRDESYAFELMREECNFLRNKYMEHAENEHGVRF